MDMEQERLDNEQEMDNERLDNGHEEREAGRKQVRQYAASWRGSTVYTG
jgi:hypothetical protein